MKKPYLAKQLKACGFKYPRIAWDWGYEQHSSIEDQINVLKNAGFANRNIYVFMLFNHAQSYSILEKKRQKCWDWRVQIVDCRYRPIDQLFDNYNPYKKHQNGTDYFIHASWSDLLIRKFRRNIRQHNICVRYNLNFYSRSLERKKVDKEIASKIRNEDDKSEIINIGQTNEIDVWFPDEYHD